MTIMKNVVMKKSLPEVSAKRTKNQILSTYNEVLERLETQEVENALKKKKKNEERQIVAKTAQPTVNSVVLHRTNLKISVTKQIDILSEKLMEEFQKLSDLRQTISIKQYHFEEMYEALEGSSQLLPAKYFSQTRQEKI